MINEGRRPLEPGWHRTSRGEQVRHAGFPEPGPGPGPQQCPQPGRVPVPEPATQGGPGAPQLRQEGLGPLCTAPTPWRRGPRATPVAAAARGGLHAAEPLLQGHRLQLLAGHRYLHVQAAGRVRRPGRVLGQRPLHGQAHWHHWPRHPLDWGHHPLPGEEQHAGRPGGAHEPASGPAPGYHDSGRSAEAHQAARAIRDKPQPPGLPHHGCLRLPSRACQPCSHGLQVLPQPPGAGRAPAHPAGALGLLCGPVARNDRAPPHYRRHLRLHHRLLTVPPGGAGLDVLQHLPDAHLSLVSRRPPACPGRHLPKRARAGSGGRRQGSVESATPTQLSHLGWRLVAEARLHLMCSKVPGVKCSLGWKLHLLSRQAGVQPWRQPC
ncbi:inactive phospholipid phosphatase 7 isoform X1 [Choloepus didactylus]|uniref:inactive phospholipid phosphatase 7 isoform X1 n=1 Tax=Choloepus didactylus TaxID=27675 RepID=UPI00189E0709|nr:inactive phospholipid phosphatase 7 isoform X1 [Choloepus didactylus]